MGPSFPPPPSPALSDLDYVMVSHRYANRPGNALDQGSRGVWRRSVGVLSENVFPGPVQNDPWPPSKRPPLPFPGLIAAHPKYCVCAKHERTTRSARFRSIQADPSLLSTSLDEVTKRLLEVSADSLGLRLRRVHP